MRHCLDNKFLTGASCAHQHKANSQSPVEIGAVYYRRSNPPESDWERDYAVAREDGHTMFRHWFTWNAVHIAPDCFDWKSYDRHLELAAANGIKTIIAEHIYEAPDWLYHSHPHARIELADGSTQNSCMGDSDATGITRMCLDNAEVLEYAKRFLFELAKHYRDNPGLYGYDIWNECSLYDAKSMCYCPATQAAFRLWVMEKYGGNLDKLRHAWRRYSLSCWDDIEMPRKIQPYPDTIDMLHFQNDSALKYMKMRYDIIREADKKHYIVAHGNAKTFCDLPACGDDYRAGEHCDIYGYTFWYGNGCHPLLSGDMIRIAAHGKEFWRAEAIGNSDWQNRGTSKSPLLEKDAMSDPANIRLDALISFVSGARGYINPRWRALQDGGLFDAFGWYNLDGSRSGRSEEVKRLALWANNPDTLPLWRAQPVRGQVGLLLLADSQFFCYSLYSATDYYSLAYQGAYEAFLACGIQSDPIKMEHIDAYRLLYLPFPTSLSNEDIERLSDWVHGGGTLIAEGCFGYFDQNGHVCERQLSRGLEKLCGAKQDTVSFAPDKWSELAAFTQNGINAGGVYRQSYLPTTGKAIAWYEDQQVAGVENAFGKGKVRIYGSMLGYGYKQSPRTEYLHTFASALPLSGQTQLVRTDFNMGLIARVWGNEECAFLWCVNTERFTQRAILQVDDSSLHISELAPIRHGRDAFIRDGLLYAEIPERDAVVLQIK